MHALIAQLVERSPCKRKVAGSIPAESKAPIAQLVERTLSKRKVSGSIPDGSILVNIENNLFRIYFKYSNVKSEDSNLSV